MKQLVRVKIPGANAAPEDSGMALIEEFLWSTVDLEDAEAARIAGVSAATLQRWRRSGSRRLRSDIRERLRRFLRQREAAGEARRQAA